MRLGVRVPFRLSPSDVTHSGVGVLVQVDPDVLRWFDPSSDPMVDACGDPHPDTHERMLAAAEELYRSVCIQLFGGVVIVPGRDHSLRNGLEPGVPLISATSDLISFCLGGTKSTLLGPSRRGTLLLDASLLDVDHGFRRVVRFRAEWCKEQKAAVVNEMIDELLETSRLLRSVFPAILS